MATNRIVINGITVEVEGSNVVVRNGVLYVDGESVQSQLSGDVNIIWEGDLANLFADGSVTCGDVEGNVTAGGSVRSQKIDGNVTAGGSVHTGGTVARGGRIGHGDISVSGINAGGSIHVRSKTGRYGSINAGGSVHLD